MRFWPATAVALALVLDTSGASAQPEADGRRGIELGLRFGYGIPAGGFGRPVEAGTNESFSHWVEGQSPIWIDAGYRFNPNLYAGLSFQYAYVFGNEANLLSCSDACVRGVTIGAALAWHLRPASSFDPWLGFGAGYEWLGIDAGVKTTSRGLQFANLQVGGDFAVGRALGVGPFLSLSFGQFSTITVVDSGGTQTSDFPETAVHEWLLIGARAVYDIAF